MGSRILPDTLSDCLELLEHRHPSSIDLGLDRCGEVWRSMGSPRPARRVFSVAGTNGKGSTVATLCALLEALGTRYGCYTSPHLVDYNERIHVNGVAVTDEDLLQAFEVVEKARGTVSLTYFEFGTLAAFEILARAHLEVAVLEVGLGGRLDAVNLIDADCAVITPIGLDHQAWLGNDLVSIGREKAGIIRPGCPVISGEPNPPSSIVDRAHDLGSPLKCLGKDFVIERVEDRARLAVDGRVLDLPLPVLAGLHQLNNLATSLAGFLEFFPEAADTPGLLERGISSVTLRGRFERICERPAIWIDVGHNPMAATAVAAALAGVSDSENLVKRRCVIGMLMDKDAESVAAELNHVVDSWYVAGLKGDRGQTGAALASRMQKSAGPLTVKVFEQISQALDSAISDAGPKDGILVFGSFLTATEALLHWRSQNHDT